MPDEASDPASDLLLRQQALLRWENEGGATQSRPVYRHAPVAHAPSDAAGAAEIEVDATLIAKGLKIESSLVQGYMRQGTITSLCERGVDEDDGRFRLTFYFRKRRFRILTDRDGNVIRDE